MITTKYQGYDMLLYWFKIVLTKRNSKWNTKVTAKLLPTIKLFKTLSTFSSWLMCISFYNVLTFRDLRIPLLKHRVKYTSKYRGAKYTLITTRYWLQNNETSPECLAWARSWLSVSHKLFNLHNCPMTKELLLSLYYR